VEDLIKSVNDNRSGIFKRDPELIVVLPNSIAGIIGDDKIYLSEFIIAKIKGKIEGYEGHPKITDEVFLKIPQSLSYPYKILQDNRRKKRKEYLFINTDPLHQIVVEVERRPGGLTEINTIFESTFGELKRLEGILPTVFSSGETPSSRMHASP
jgi:hypothetical protein